MKLKDWDELPEQLKNESVKVYYDHLAKKSCSLRWKRIFDLITAIIIFIVLFPMFLLLCIAIKLDSKGPVFFRQERVTQYGKLFKIYKFRTMVENAEQLGSQVTVKGDRRVTRIGKVLRKYRLDEIPQLLNIIAGDMSFVGTRPEVMKYVEKYTDEMMATLLLPAGLTSETSIQYKDEEKLLTEAEDVDKTYVEVILPEKMKLNLQSIKTFSLWNDFITMVRTVVYVFRRSD